MDGQEYLTQISAENRPIKKSKRSIFTSRYFVLGITTLILLIIIIIIGTIIKASKGDVKNDSYALLLHVGNTSEQIHTYQPEVKSSYLRSSSASLYGVLTNTKKTLTDYLVEKYNYSEGKIDKNLIDEADLNKEELNTDLFEAKINGTLDRIYAHKMAYEISILTSEETKIINTTDDSRLKEILTTSKDGLDVLYENFNSFSEAK
jgi:hypothetical protein